MEKIQCKTALFMFLGILIASNAYTNQPSERKINITCEVSLKLESPVLQSERYEECESKIRMCSENGFYEIKGPMRTIEGSTKFGFGRVSFDAEGNQKGDFDGDFYFDFHYAFGHLWPNPNPEILYFELKLRDSRPEIPHFDFGHGQYGMGIPMGVGEEMRVSMSMIPQHGLKINKIHGDDELREITVLCKRNS